MLAAGLSLVLRHFLIETCLDVIACHHLNAHCGASFL